MADSAAETARFRVEGMDCAACATKIETAVRRVPGVTEASASFTAGTLNVTHDGSAQRAAIEKAVRHVGYGVAGADRKPSPALAHDHDHDDGDAHGHGDGESHFELGQGPWWKTRKAMLAGGTAVAMLAAYLITLVAPEIGHWAFLGALALGLVPIGWRAFTGATSGTPFSIETLMTIAAIGAVIIGATEEAATVVLLFLVGELLEGIAARRARASIQSLSDLVPKTALVEENGATREVPAASLKVGMTILVRPGDRMPADGQIIEGSSAIDEAPVTGESVPKRKSAGDEVFAGTINTDAVLRVKVMAAAADNTIARVVRLVEEAQESKAPTERFIDRFSRWYTPGVLVVGALVAIVPPLLFGQDWSEWIYKGLATLLIGCPCALVISTPAAIAAGLSNGAKRGMLLKGGAVLENLRRINMVALDKTGTLTAGKPAVTDIVALDGTSETQILSLAAALETGSSHPLAVAILARAKEAKAPVPPATAARAIAGKGVSARVGGKEVLLASASGAGVELGALVPRIDALNDDGKTVSVLVVDGAALGLIAMRDEPRDDAREGLAALRTLGIGTVMLTGDNARTAAAIGRDLGIEVRAGLLPEDKQRIVRELMSQGRVVAKVGDGINDAPALAAADIGIAMGGGTDVALETADAAVLHGRVGDIAAMVRLSQGVMRNIGQNITISLGLKAVFLVTTLIGITGLWPAILADTGATVLVTANALRLLRAKS
ncbi:MAG: cadmium-translocating P-type ATPase [Hyphomicrobiales bacterium]|nr:MAG: cadmium-translocating P-type ATPase [Hyphomicrobiales bacterium]